MDVANSAVTRACGASGWAITEWSTRLMTADSSSWLCVSPIVVRSTASSETGLSHVHGGKNPGRLFVHFKH